MYKGIRRLEKEEGWAAHWESLSATPYYFKQSVVCADQ